MYVVNFEQRKSDLSINEFGKCKVSSKEAGRLLSQPGLCSLPITAPHLQGRNEVENRNGACEMEFAVMGSRAKLRTKEGGKLNQSYSVGVEGRWVLFRMKSVAFPY